VAIAEAIDSSVRLNVGTDTRVSIRGDGQYGPTRGFLGVQGTSNFDGVTSLDISGFETGVLGISTGSSATDNYGVLGHANFVGIRGENSGDPSADWGELGAVGTGVRASGQIAGVNAKAGLTGGIFDGGLIGVHGISPGEISYAGMFEGRGMFTDHLEFGTVPYAEGGIFDGILRAGHDADDGNRLYPPVDQWGYVGAFGDAWWSFFSYNYYQVSRRETKRDIQPVREDLMELVMEDIDRLQPSFYKYHVELDELLPGQETKFRPNMHLGLILDEVPDYLKDNTLSGVDVYATAALGLAGVKHNRGEIKAIQSALGMGAKQRIEDFGSAEMTETKVWVSFETEFAVRLSLSETIPTVTVTPNTPGVSLSVTEKTSEGFEVTASGGELGSTFDWIAMARVTTSFKKEDPVRSIDPQLLEQLHLTDRQRALVEEAMRAEKRKMEEAERQEPPRPDLPPRPELNGVRKGAPK